MPRRTIASPLQARRGRFCFSRAHPPAFSPPRPSFRKHTRNQKFKTPVKARGLFFQNGTSRDLKRVIQRLKRVSVQALDESCIPGYTAFYQRLRGAYFFAYFLSRFTAVPLKWTRVTLQKAS